MSTENDSRDIKEILGFRRGDDVFVYLVEAGGGEAELLGPLRPDYARSEPRLYEEFNITIEHPEEKRIYFGQEKGDPRIIQFEQKTEGEYNGVFLDDHMEAHAKLVRYSPYSYYENRFVLSLDLRVRDFRRAENVLPEGWT